MRKLIIALLSFCFLFTLSLPAAADVIWEPYGDSFYEDHREETEYENRIYKATRDMDLYEAPNGKKLKATPVYASELFNVQYIYEDENGVLWGNCYFAEVDSAWVNLTGSIRPYDRADFKNDYISEFSEITEQPDKSFYEQDVPVYDYPGAESSLYNIVVQPDASYLPAYAHTYTDPAGNVWAEIFYYMGMDGWVLLEGDISTAAMPDKAKDTVITAKNDIAEPDATAEQNNPDETVSDSEAADQIKSSVDAVEDDNSKMLMPVLLVIVVVAVTLVILFVFFRKKKK